ncbi:MAG TPA: DivIVA domain-containing protein [Gaiellaceae bacterium]|jgi:cell division initiation protein
MTLTPVEIRHVDLGRRLLGYDRTETDALLAEIVESFEGVWRERADLRDEVERMEAEIARFKELEVLLRNTLLSAERSADDIRGQARREADLILEEARTQARETAVNAEAERERVKADVRRLRTLDNEMRAEYKAFLLRSLDRVESDTQEHELPERVA